MSLDFLTNNNARLEALRNRERALRAQITEEATKQSRRAARNRARLASLIGEAILQLAGQDPEVKSIVTQALGASTLDQSSLRFIRKTGWL